MGRAQKQQVGEDPEAFCKLADGITAFSLERSSYFLEETLLADEIMMIIKRCLKLHSKDMKSHD